MPDPAPLDEHSTEHTPRQTSQASTLLKWGAAVFVVVGGGITIWILDKATRYPEAQARQFDNAAPLWIPAAVFVVIATLAGVYVLLRAARRITEGEDLYAQRHRRHRSDVSDADDDSQASSPDEDSASRNGAHTEKDA